MDVKVRKLTNQQIDELKVLNGIQFWDKMAEFYQDDEEVSRKIEFEKSYLSSSEAIPTGYPCYWKTQKTYMDTVKDFCEMVGFPVEEEPEFEDCFLEKAAAKLGIDVDINGDGITSFEKYKK